MRGTLGAAGPKGCIGIWKEPLLPGAYYLNRHAYDVTLVDTRVQTWEYKGGYTRRSIDLSVDQQGNITQTERTVDVPKPDAVDLARVREGRRLGHSARAARAWCRSRPRTRRWSSAPSAATRRSSIAF